MLRKRQQNADGCKIRLVLVTSIEPGLKHMTFLLLKLPNMYIYLYISISIILLKTKKIYENILPEILRSLPSTPRRICYQQRLFYSLPQ